jgi:uncharacterized protein
MNQTPSDIVFSDAVKAAQSQRGSRAQYERMERGVGWSSALTPELSAFITSVRSCFIATASAAGQPSIQHRGGPPGFLKVLDPHTIGFADYGGNKQYVSIGNLSENPRYALFIMDYARRIRIKVWGAAKVIEGEEKLLETLSEGSNTAPERAILLTVDVWDRNCPQHIPQMFFADDVAAHIAKLEARIGELEHKLAEGQS